MTEVRRHGRKTASGRTVPVRQHHRRGGDSAERERQAPEREPGGAFVGDMSEARPGAAEPGDIWADGDEQPPEGDWWADDDEPGWGGNYAAPGAQVGMQARDVVIGGGIFMGGDDGPQVGTGAPGPVTPVQAASANVARSGDAVGVQGAQIHDAGARPSERARYQDPAMRKVLGLDTPEGAERFDRLTRLREAGYDGPVDQDGNPMDTSDPANATVAAIFEDLRKMGNG